MRQLKRGVALALLAPALVPLYALAFFIALVVICLCVLAEWASPIERSHQRG